MYKRQGYGFVEMADDEAGDKAIAALNEVDMDGKTLSYLYKPHIYRSF